MLNQFSKDIFNSDQPNILYFCATWSGNCYLLELILNEVKAEFGSLINICKVDVDEEKDLVERYRVNEVPTLIIFSKGQIVSTITKVVSSLELIKLIQPILYEEK